MAFNTLYFVSKRLQAVVAALICLAFVQLIAMAGHEAEHPGSIMVAIQR